MRRFSVRSVMVLIVGAAVGLAALRNANFFWASASATAVVVAVATSVVGALTLRGPERYAWAGFAVFCGLYLAVTVGSVFSDPFKESLGTVAALNYVQSHADPYPIVPGPDRDFLQQRRAELVRGIRTIEPSTENNPTLDDLKRTLSALDPKQA
jgi:hypothetical protein